MIFNWKLSQAPRIAWFLTRQRVHSMIDRKVHKQRRDAAVLAHVQANAAAGNAADVLGAMDDFARRHRWLMNIGPKKGRILLDAVQEAEARNMLEIGAYCGYSATMIGDYLSKQGGKLTSIEKSPKHAAVAREVVSHAGLSHCVEVHTGTLSSELDSLAGPFDAVLLDHWKDEYLPDLKRLEQAGLLQAGTVVIADNVGFFAVPEYLEYVRNSGRYASRYMKSSVEYNEKLEDGVEVSVFSG